MTPCTRWLPDRPLPPYTYVPGRTPHPVSDPRGHSFGNRNEDAEPPPAVAGQAVLNGLLWGIDLFNHGYFWEAHEAWEGLWHAAGRRGATADLFKALIQLAVAGVKHYEGRDEGMRRHAARAKELLQPFAGSLVFGLRVTDLICMAESIAAAGWPPEPPVLRFDGTAVSVGLAESESQRQQ
ncbi:MAG: DUF309 domain-containing protein [Gemmataceae bacterium]|nr:DUF309 domain-containing protein [Gemmataceae bacterium]